MRVLIAGAGPTGLTLGIDLARRGVDVRVVDKADGFFAGSRGDGIQPRTLEVFDDLGVLDAVLAQGAPPAPIRVHLDGQFVGTRRMAEPREATPDVPQPNPWVLGQSQLEAILRARLAEFGVRVELGTELVGLSQDADGLTARLSTGGGRPAAGGAGAAGSGGVGSGGVVEEIRVDFLVGADGGASFVRKAVGVAFPGTTDEAFRVLVGDVAAPGLDPGSGHWFASAADPMSGIALTPLPGTGCFQYISRLGADDDASLGTMQAALDGFCAGVQLTGHGGWSTVWRPNVRLAEHYRVGRVFLAGDAAHVHPPTGGQGMNTGVQDAYNLGWKLASGDEALLATYEPERRTVAARVLGVSTELLARYAEGRADAHKRGPEGFGLDITYRAADATGDTLAVGDRAPDAPLLDAHGKHVRLFDLFRGPHATRLVFGRQGTEGDEHTYTLLRGTAAGHAGDAGDVGDAAGAADLRLFVDAEGHAFAAYAAAAGDGILIRPDGYVAEIVRH
jgi:2-polyprenyl-6-methoxyphenol hydroxylase-like FAD-dependent oxidoreductase